MIMKAMLRVLLVTTSFLLVVISADAQERHKFFFKAPSGQAQYTQRHVVDVGDVPGHQISVSEMHAKYTKEAPVFDGVREIEDIWSTQSDLVSGNGRSWGFGVILLENGDKLFMRTENVLQSTAAPDGARQISLIGVNTYIGGTGKFKGMRGTLKSTSSTDLKTGLGDTVVEGEWWIEN